MVGAAKGFAVTYGIDSLANLKKRRIYVFSGTKDSVVLQQAVDATVEFFRRVGVTAAHLKYVNDVPARHALITPSYGNDCAANVAPYISHCTVGGTGYDRPGRSCSTSTAARSTIRRSTSRTFRPTRKDAGTAGATAGRTTPTSRARR